VTFANEYVGNCLRRPVGNGLWRVEWSRDRWRHVTLKVKLVTPIRLESNIS